MNGAARTSFLSCAGDEAISLEAGANIFYGYEGGVIISTSPTGGEQLEANAGMDVILKDSDHS